MGTLKLHLTGWIWIVVVIAASLVGLVIWRSLHESIDADVYPREQIEVGGVQRNFRLVVPHRMKGGPVPIVFAFHGIGDAPDAMPNYSDLDRLACEQGFVLVYPIASGRMWRTERPTATAAENLDIQFFDALLEHVKQRQDIDDKRVYLMGMSNGASFAQVLALQRSDEIAAVVAHSGVLPSEWQSATPRRRFPILLVVGAYDAVSAIEDSAKIYQGKGYAIELITIPRLGHTWGKVKNEEFWGFLSDKRLEVTP